MTRIVLLIVFSAFSSVALAQQAFDEIAGLINLNPEKAKIKLDSFHRNAVVHQEDTLVVKSLYLKGIMSYLDNEYYVSVDYYKRALNYQRYLKQNPEMHIAVWNNLGICYELTDQLDDAFQAYDESLTLATQMGDSVSIGMTWINLGLLAVNQNNLDLGAEYLNKAEVFFKYRKDSPYYRGMTYNNLHLLHDKKGSPVSQLIKYSDLAVAAFEEASDTVNLFLAKGNNLLALLRHGGQDGRMTQALNALKILEDQAQPPATLRAFLQGVYGRYALSMGDCHAAFSHFEKALSIYREQLNVKEVENTYQLLLNAQACKGDYQAYQNLFAESIEVVEKLKQQRSKIRYEELAALYELNQKEEAIAALNDEVTGLDSTLQQVERSLTKNRIIIIILVVFLLALISLVLLLFERQSLRRLQRILFKQNRKLDLVENKLKAPQHDRKEEGEEDESTRLLFEKMEQYIQENESYLVAQLGIMDLCRDLNTNANYLSKAIKAYSGGNFSKYVNGYRVRKAKELIKDLALDQGTAKNINEIYLHCGFNSYSTFFRVFKSDTGLSPNQYLKLLTEELQEVEES